MNFTELFNMSSLAASSGVDYSRLRTNLLARREKVKLTTEEREAVIKAASHGFAELKAFLS